MESYPNRREWIMSDSGPGDQGGGMGGGMYSDISDLMVGPLYHARDDSSEWHASLCT